MGNYEKHRETYKTFVWGLPQRFADWRGGFETIWDQNLAESWKEGENLEATVDAFESQKKIKDFGKFLEMHFHRTAKRYNPGDYEPDFGI